MDKMKSLFFSSLLVVVSTLGLAQNPIIQTNYTADPAPMVYNDKVYLYTTHDEDNSTWFTMNDWRLYTTSDMVNWTDHGEILNSSQVSWGRKDGGSCGHPIVHIGMVFTTFTFRIRVVMTGTIPGEWV